jgi:nucleotide-binding universal stress UspA family protein
MGVLAAIDGEDGSDTVVAEAWTLAERFDEPLHVAYVYDHSEHSSLATENVTIEGRRRPDDEEVRRLAEDFAAEATDGVTDEYEVVGRRGTPGEEIVEYADDIDARYLVIGGRRRSPAGKALFGSVSQAVILGSDRPVVVVSVE